MNISNTHPALLPPSLDAKAARQAAKTAVPKANPKRPARPAVGVLDELLGTGRGERSADGVLKMIETELIHARKQAREVFDESSLAELRASIRETREKGLGIEGTGLLQPLTVRADPQALEGQTSYLLIAGERRFRAAQALGLKEVPAIVVLLPGEAVSDGIAAQLQLIENLQRENLRPLEEARALQTFRQAQNLSVRDLARVLGKGKGYIEHRLALLSFGEDVQHLVAGRPDAISIARQIDTIKEPPLRRQLLGLAAAGASRTQIEAAIQAAIQAASVAAQKLANAGADAAAIGPTISTVSPVRQSKAKFSNVDLRAHILMQLENAKSSVEEATLKLQEYSKDRKFSHKPGQELESALQKLQALINQ